MLNLSPDIIKTAEANTNLAEAKDNQTIQLTAELFRKGAINRASTVGVSTIGASTTGLSTTGLSTTGVSTPNTEKQGKPLLDLPPRALELQTKTAEMEKFMTTHVPEITPEYHAEYEALYREYMDLVIPLYQAEIKRLQEVSAKAEKESVNIDTYVYENHVTQGEAKDLYAKSSKFKIIAGSANIKRRQLERDLIEIEAGPQVGHCTIEDKSPEVLAVEKKLQLEMVTDGKYYDVSTTVNKYASSLAKILDITTYSVYIKGDNLYFIYEDKENGDVYLKKYTLNDDKDGIIKYLKKNDDPSKESNSWKLPNPPADKQK